MSAPVLRVLSLGAGVQSSCLLLLSLTGELPRVDAAVFADTGWEPRAVYQHLARLEATAAQAGVPVYRVSAGNLRRDALDPGHRLASMPLHVRRLDGGRGMIRCQRTREYKITRSAGRSASCGRPPANHPSSSGWGSARTRPTACAPRTWPTSRTSTRSSMHA